MHVTLCVRLQVLDFRVGNVHKVMVASYETLRKFTDALAGAPHRCMTSSLGPDIPFNSAHSHVPHCAWHHFWAAPYGREQQTQQTLWRRAAVKVQGLMHACTLACVDA